MSRPCDGRRRRLQLEVEDCARRMFVELTGGAPRREFWYSWYLCERHGGTPLVDPSLPAGQVAYWDGVDIVVAGEAPIPEIVRALPEELAHRLSGAAASRFEPMNYFLLDASQLDRTEFQERVGQRVAELFGETNVQARD